MWRWHQKQVRVNNDLERHSERLKKIHRVSSRQQNLEHHDIEVVPARRGLKAAALTSLSMAQAFEISRPGQNHQ
jgi:hypothetical protein